MRKTKRALLLTVILLSLGAVTYKVADVVRQMKKVVIKRPVAVLDSLLDSALRIKDFHRAKIENGRKVWELFGDEANYLKDKREALIKRPRFLYYDRKDEAAETSAATAHIFLNEKELERLELKGRVRLPMKGYVLTSRNRRITSPLKSRSRCRAELRSLAKVFRSRERVWKSN